MAVSPARTPASISALRGQIARLAWPAMLEMVLNMSVWMFDVAMVGRLGAGSLSVTGVAGQVYWSLMYLVGGFGVAATAMVARRVGAGEMEEAARVGSQGVLLALVSGAAVSLLLWLGAPVIFGLTGLDPEIAAVGVVYLRIICFAAPFLVVGWAFAGILRGFGDTRTPMFIMGFVNVLNISLGYSLIFGKFGLPALGVRGSAAAALIAQISGSLLLLLLIASGKLGRQIELRRAFKPNWADVGRVLRLAAPASVENFLVDLARTVGVFAISSLGALSVAAHEVTAATESLSFMPGSGIATATSVLVGQSLGASDPGRAGAVVRESARLGLIFMGSVGVLFLLVPGILVRVFTTDPAIIALACRCLRVTAFAQPLMALQGVLAGALRGAGDTRSPMIIGGLTSWCCRVTLTYLAVFVFGRDLPWVWGVMVLDWGFKVIWLALAYRRGHWQTVRV